MKALIKQAAEPGLSMGELPIPAIGHNDILIKITKTAVCGTDMHIFNWDPWAQRTIDVPRAIASVPRGTSPAATAATAAPAAATCAATPSGSA